MAKHNVYPYTQTTIALCWEACARMLWHFRHGGLNGYSQRAGHYLSITTGQTENQMDRFYKQLGMRSLSQPHTRNLTHALRWSPVIFALVGQQTGHAVVASGEAGGQLDIVNPCAMMSVDFETDASSCTAGAGQLPLEAVGQRLGAYIWYW